MTVGDILWHELAIVGCFSFLIIVFILFAIAFCHILLKIIKIYNKVRVVENLSGIILLIILMILMIVVMLLAVVGIDYHINVSVIT